MRRAPLRRGAPLRSGAPPARRTPLARRTPPRSGERARAADGGRRGGLAASDAQREKIVGRWCVVGQQTRGITPAHLTPRALGGCDDPLCTVPLCWLHHRAYDTGRLELLPYLEPRWRAEVAHAVLHLGLIGAYRRLTNRRVAG
jgi:hypothetical protein